MVEILNRDVATNPMFEDKHLVCNGIRLHYLDWGNPHLKPLVLVHGIRGHAHLWDTFAQTMRDRYHVLALDLRGHGDSQWTADGSYRVEDYIADLNAFVKTLGLNGFHMAGLSLGGIVALGMAAVSSETVDRLVIVDIGPDLSSDGLDRLRQNSGGVPDDFCDIEEAYRLARDYHVFADDDELRRGLQLNLRRMWDGRLHWKYDPATDRVIDAGTPRNSAILWRAWSMITCPTLIVRGEQSDLLRPEVAREMAARALNASLVEIPGAGHVVMQDNPAGFRDAVTAFLQDA